jgi:hypothetical protein
MVKSFTGFSSTAAILATYLSLNIRDGRRFWTNTKSHPTHEDNVLQRSSAANSILVGSMTFGIVIVSFILGYVIGLQKDASINPTQTNDEFNFNPINQSIPICNIRYGNRFSLIEFGTLAGVAYSTVETDVSSFVSRNSALNDAFLFQSNVNTTLSATRSKGVQFMEFRFKNSTNVSVVAIRGTASVEDVLQDMLIWSSPILLQTSSYFGTMIKLWPQGITARFVRFVSSYVAFSNFVYVNSIQATVQALIKEGREVYLTG